MVPNSKVLWFLSSSKLGPNAFSAIRRFSSENAMLVQEISDKAILTFNRPKVLNCLNCALVTELHSALKRFENNKTLIIVKGTGGKAYCAGGDLQTILKNTNTNNVDNEKLLAYMNASILYMSAKRLPIIAFIDGITLGGGVGLSVFGKYQVATEKTLFGMPESKIGFHPNAGASYFFTRLSGRLGWYLGLTGQSLNGTDAVRIGLASHYCHSNNLQQLESKLLNCTDEHEIASTLDTFCDTALPEFSLEHVKDKIDACFSAPSVEKIVSRLSMDSSDWAKKTIQTLRKLSPTSLKVILRQLDMGKQMSLKECLLMEFKLSMNFWKFHDVYEGVRATLIDKDHNPRWNPSTLSQVSDELVESHFSSNIYEEEHKQMLQPLEDLQ